MNQHSRINTTSYGFTLLEVLLAMLVGAILILGLSEVVGSGLSAHTATQEKIDLNSQGNFAIQRMATAVSLSKQLWVPQADNPNTDWSENLRKQSIPAQPAEGSSSFARAYLVLSQPDTIDLDGDGFADSDDDKDGDMDEDFPADISNDQSSGVYLVDDDGDGSIDEGLAADDDEQWAAANEDSINGLDDDNDNSFDEDPGADMNADTCPGACSVDDDGDGSVDEGLSADDDEDGLVDEDPLNALVFYLEGSLLYERTPVPWDENGDSVINGRDFVLSKIAQQVSHFEVERELTGSGDILIRLLLILKADNGEPYSFEISSRLGAGH